MRKSQGIDKSEIWAAQQLGMPKDAAQIRQNVFIEEQGFQNEFDEIDGRAYHVVLYVGKSPAATGRTFEAEDGVYCIGRVAVLKQYRGQGLGAVVLELLETKAAELGAGQVRLSAQLQARTFYEKHGYAAYGAEYRDEFCPHIGMKKQL